MKRSYCTLCHRIHKSFNWRYAQYETPDGKRYGWFCDKWFTPAPYPEFMPQRIKDDRPKYAKSLMQPYRGGVASQEYIDTYGTKRINPKDVKKAKNVWGDILPMNWKKSL
jgi:hypothetical protein